MTSYRFSGLDDFKKLYADDSSSLPSISAALLLGFSSENYLGFRDRIQNQITILSFLKDEFEQSQSNRVRFSFPVMN